MADLSNLNSMQQEAARQIDGPVLILAGAGSGKTTVLVNRIAHMIEDNNIAPYKIMAITFTNKAANEMKERVTRAIGDAAEDMWLCTFHAACVRILRSHIDRLGFGSSFVIYDTSDTKTVMKECYKELDIDDKILPMRAVLSAISKAKDNMQDASIYSLVNNDNFHAQRIAEAYELYQKKLKANNALDFDDILFFTVRLLSENPDILEKYQNRFQYIMVDEYQDTNNSQYMLISMLAAKHQNICVVGDDDQSIYKFRGANIQNILNFEDTFPDTKVIKLEQNYRSTQTILDAANSVIHNNHERKDKALWTDNGRGEKIRVFNAENERSEAMYLAREISNARMRGSAYSDFAVLYRTNAQSRVIEDIFLRNAIPYKVVGGLRFYDRKEIKDIIAFLRLIHNLNDNLSFQRIINEPKRGIGATTIGKIVRISNMEGVSCFEVARNAHIYSELSSASVKLIEFCEMILNLQKSVNTVSVKEFTERVLTDTGYTAALVTENTVEAKTRIDNLGEFLSAVSEYEKGEDEPTLSGFLESVSLVSDLDSYDDNEDVCIMMTIHSAKGLEFPTVFLVGMEENLFPSMRSIDKTEDLEEERRLCYVAITRARETLYLTNAQTRTQYGKTTHQVKSRFLNEIPAEFLEDRTPKKAENTVRAIPHTEFRKAKNELFRNISSASSAPTVNIEFAPGDKVRHKKFGDGTVSAVQRFEKDALLEIKFESGETKRLMAVMAKLEKI